MRRIHQSTASTCRADLKLLPPLAVRLPDCSCRATHPLPGVTKVPVGTPFGLPTRSLGSVRKRLLYPLSYGAAPSTDAHCSAPHRLAASVLRACRLCRNRL